MGVGVDKLWGKNRWTRGGWGDLPMPKQPKSGNNDLRWRKNKAMKRGRGKGKMTESQRRLNVKNRVQQRKQRQQRQQQQQQQTDLEATSEEVSQESVQQKLAEIEALLGGVDPAPEAPTDSSAPPLPSTPSSGDLLSKLASIEQQLALVASDSDDEGDGEDDDGEGEGEDEECSNNNDNDSNVEDQPPPPVSSADLLDRLAS